ncbi:DC-STAMP domain-containing protein 2 [Salarias fasciatus]|uniref:DC-STAMP domain-containing protein 2 n=1 Tax=Salarias fasciatus TaxID=181472 RepID=UPI0011766B99|nr:DC-STAMP domain-containing protein 2 [Salarias fasciatus]
MEVEERRRRLPSGDDIQEEEEEREGTRSAAGGPHRSALATSLLSSRRFRGHLADGGRSLLAFVCGLLLASLYGLTSLLLNQPLWFCLHSTLVLAGLAAFSMGLSAAGRARVALMLPSLCSGRGRSFVLLLFVTTLTSGPLANTLENAERAASSLLCGAELAANQTQELIQRSATPLFTALDQIRAISRNAYAVAGRVQDLVQSMMDSVRHVARTLRNVLRFLVDIGDVCNDVLGSPYRKCRAVFSDARSDCADLLGDFDFLCGVVDAFLPLCGVARAGELFCVIPAYIATHLRERLAAPAVAAFQKLKREFDFNLTASVSFDVDANRSRSLQQASQDIVEELSSDLRALRSLGDPLKYVSFVLLAVAFMRAAQYRHSYLGKLDFDNIYISAQFKELDEQEKSRGGASVLPLTRKEATTYITPMRLGLTAGERRSIFKGAAQVLRHLVGGVLLVALDFLLFWALDQVHHQLTGDVVARAPVTVGVQVNGSGYASDVFRDLVASFDVLQQGNITVISSRCLLEPSQPDWNTCFALGLLLGVALLFSVVGGFMQRCRRIVCASFYPERELERIRFLHQKILDQRSAAGGVLRRSAIQNAADRGGGGGLQALLTRLPAAGVRLSRLLGVSSSASCLACGDAVKPGDSNTVTCDVPQCSGLYCRPCFLSVGNTCVVCMRPLTFQEDGEEELDSSDDEQLQLWSSALDPPGLGGRDRTLMERRIAVATQRSRSETSEADLEYQDQPESSESDEESDEESDGDAADPQDVPLRTVLAHQPESP